MGVWITYMRHYCGGVGDMYEALLWGVDHIYEALLWGCGSHG